MAFRQSLITAAGKLGAWRLTRRLTRTSPRIFMFHRFQCEANRVGMRGDELRAFIRQVGQECDFVTMRELVRRLQDGPRAGRPLAVITVDDGYADFHASAFPVLRELGVPATVYATGGFIDRRCWLWWDALRYLIDTRPAGDLRLQVANESLCVHLGDERSRHGAWSQIADQLVRSNQARATVLDRMAYEADAPLPEVPTIEYAAMTWSQLVELEAAGIEIGGHTMTHAFLPGLDPDALQAEIAGGKALIERHLDTPLQTFAYPNGMGYDHTAEVEAAVRAAGYSAAVVAFPKAFRTDRMYQLGRWSVHPGSPMLEHVLSGASELKLRLVQS